MLPRQTGICNETPELCGGNIIKLVKEGNEEERDDIRPISHLAVARPGPRPLRPRKADQSARDQEKGKGGLKYANPRDKYILILLEYKLMLQLSG